MGILMGEIMALIQDEDVPMYLACVLATREEFTRDCLQVMAERQAESLIQKAARS
jgi:hypothetical protein